jgi:membrane-associated phospholipid phosphatase
MVRLLTHVRPLLHRFIRDRLSTREYLGLHLTLGLLFCAAAMRVFVEIIDDVRDHDRLAAFDQVILKRLHHEASPAGIEWAKIVSSLGSVAAFTWIGIVVAAVLMARKHRVLLAGWVSALAGGGILDWSLKVLFQRPRPSWRDPFVVYPPWSWSFPSGHAIESLLAYGMMAYLLIILMPGGLLPRILVAICAAALILTIGFSRLYLGVHYPSDILGGFTVGFGWLCVCVTGLESVRRYPSTKF